MTFYEKLRKKLESKIPKKKLDLLPRSYQIIGRLFLIKLKPKLTRHKKKIGNAILDLFPYIHTVFLIKGIKEKTRKPDIEVIAGCRQKKPVPYTQTLHKEYGCKFLLDISEVMWSKGNKNERQRLIGKAKKGEIIVDMFAGIGYFSIFLAKYSKAKRIYSIEINSKSAEYLRKNVWMNGVENKIEVLEGDCRKFAQFLESIADRIVMGYLFDTEKYLKYALKIAKRSCFIHFHRIFKKEELEKIKEKIAEIGKKEGYKIIFLEKKEVKTYAPNVSHYVLDLKSIKF